MISKKINSEKMKQNNAKIVMDSIRFAENISRKELANEIGLTPATITNIVNLLLKKRYIKEVGEETTVGGGRRPILLSINENACGVLGIELLASKITCVLTDFNARVLRTKIMELDHQKSADDIVSDMVDIMNGVLEEEGITSEQVGGIGLATPGPCDVENGIMINPPNLPMFHNYPIKEVIETRMKLPVIYEHHTVSSGFCEVWLGKAKQSKCMVLCSVLEVGIACSIFINGKVFRGFHNTSGEIGHMIIDRNGQKCACGNYGCLEPMADARALVDRVKRKFKANPQLCEKYGVENVDNMDLDYVLKHEREDVFYEELVKCAQYVGIALCNVIMILSPDTIVLSGDLPDKSELYAEEVKKFIRMRVYPRHNSEIYVYNTDYKEIVGALGGVALVMDDMSKHI